MESVERLKEKLAIAESRATLDKEIQQSRCPICGSKLEYEIANSINECYSYAICKIHCVGCHKFVSESELSSTEAYHWKTDGSSELNLLRKCFGEIKSYVVK